MHFQEDSCKHGNIILWTARLDDSFLVKPLSIVLSSTEQLPVNLLDWTENDVFHWLVSIGIPEKIAHAFREEAIDDNVLAIYNGDEILHDFQKRGLKIGHLRKILHQRKKYQDFSYVQDDSETSGNTSVDSPDKNADHVNPHTTRESKYTDDRANTADHTAQNAAKELDTIQHAVKQPEITEQSGVTATADCSQQVPVETKYTEQQVSDAVQHVKKDFKCTHIFCDSADHGPSQHVKTKLKKHPTAGWQRRQNFLSTWNETS